MNVNNTSIRKVESTAVAAQLRNLCPTVGKKSFGGKSSNSKCVQGKKPPARKAKKDVVHRDFVLLPSPDTKSVPTRQTRCPLENNGFVVHAVPVDKSLQEEDLPAQVRELFPPLTETDFEFVKSCSGQIITPKLAIGVHFSALRVPGLAGQGSIYIWPECDISASLCHDPSPRSLLPEQVENADDGECSSFFKCFIPFNCCLIQQCIKSRKAGSVERHTPWRKQQHATECPNCHGSVRRGALFLSFQNLPFESDIGDDDDDSLLQPVFFPANEKPDSLDAGLSNQKEKPKVDEDMFNNAVVYILQRSQL